MNHFAEAKWSPIWQETSQGDQVPLLESKQIKVSRILPHEKVIVTPNLNCETDVKVKQVVSEIAKMLKGRVIQEYQDVFADL